VRIVVGKGAAVAEGPFRNKARAGTYSSRRRTRPCPAGPAADRSMDQEDTPSGRCTASARRTTAAHHTVSGRRTAAGRRTASCRRTAYGHRTADGLQTDVGPGGGKVEDNEHLVEERSRSGRVAPASSPSGPLGILGLVHKPSLGTADPIDTAGQEAGRAWAGAACRLVLLRGVAFGLHPREEVGSAGLQHYLVVVPPVLCGIRLPFSMTVGTWYGLA
jgi:hypothetical protein